ncbi:uncharacterized protein LOC128244397 [Mya arenaria]|uniref:uncharacterized protein LOC128244397 n=1 Tax=Mya arenaria TaxID=6604 RepID=UPI0022E154AA|nr:uncharacterized protein LOC128244397 [Mya arenaria]
MIVKYGIVVFLLQYLIPGIPAPPGHSTICKTCNNVNHPGDCHHQETCHHGFCSEDVYLHNGTYIYRLGCKEHAQCEHDIHLVGRRAIGRLVCSECCDHTGCQTGLCSHYAHQPTTTPPPVTIHHSVSYCRMCTNARDPYGCHHVGICHDTD